MIKSQNNNNEIKEDELEKSKSPRKSKLDELIRRITQSQEKYAKDQNRENFGQYSFLSKKVRFFYNFKKNG